MDLYLCMQHFVTVARYKSFSTAARHLNLNRPTLSKHISWLENTHLQTQLIERTTRKFALTAAGRTYLQQAEKILTEIEDSKRIVLDVTCEMQGVITIACPIVVHNSILLPYLKKFLQKYPKINLHFVDENHPTALLDGSVDLLISSFDIDEPQFVKVNLLKNERRLFAAPSYIKKNGAPKIPAELTRHSCLINKSLPLPCTWSFANDESVMVSGRFTSSSGLALVAAAIQGLGIIWVNEFAVAAEVEQGLLQKIPCIAPSPQVGLHLYYLPTLPTNRIRVLAEYLQAHMPATMLPFDHQ